MITDTERFDAEERNKFWIVMYAPHDGLWYVYDQGTKRGQGKTRREAVDAAIMWERTGKTQSEDQFIKAWPHLNWREKIGTILEMLRTPRLEP